MIDEDDYHEALEDLYRATVEECQQILAEYLSPACAVTPEMCIGQLLVVLEDVNLIAVQKADRGVADDD